MNEQATGPASGRSITMSRALHPGRTRPSAARPSEGAKAPPGGSAAGAAAKRGGHIS